MGSGPPVVLLHGLGGSLLWWGTNVEPLARHFRVIAVDLPGHGLSAKPAIAYTLPFASRFLEGLLDALSLDEASLVGHSTGGLVALRFALDHPERVARLVLVDSPGLGREVDWVLSIMTLPLLGEVLATPRRRTVRRFLKRLFTDPHLVTEGLLEQNLEERRHPGARRALLSILRHGANFRGIKQRVILRDELHHLRVPTLIVWGQEDRILPVSQAHVAHGLIADSRLHVFPGCGHCPPLERRQEFNQLLITFLSGAVFDSPAACR